ncbi:MAG: tRNA preQ1(34) S-adenosylmethionine ribosyltransferase-isomerase QueA [Chthoniobacterales bacterium]
MSGLTSDYDYPLPESLIASRPLPHREDSRMMVINRATGKIGHHTFKELPNFLQPDDLLVLNNSRVRHARVFANEGTIELLFLEQRDPLRWLCMVRPGRKMRIGATCRIGDVTARVIGIEEPGGERVIEFDKPVDFDRAGHVPIPPYMHREADADDDIRYQTVYANPTGSVAAPTAGLHFTPEILASIPHVFLTLHVGIGTFRPIMTDRLEDHALHKEKYEISPESAEKLNTAHRLIAVGTTSVRTLESQPSGDIHAGNGATDIFIRPGFSFQRIGGMLTNFHLPKSSLLVLVCTFGGHDLLLEAYHEAVREKYRFYSYGDCMLIF